MKKYILSIVILIMFTGCLSVTTGLKLAEFGVSVGFQVHDYAESKRAEAKVILDNNITK